MTTAPPRGQRGVQRGAPPVRWALAGYGPGGRVFHAPLIASAPGIELAAVVTGDGDRRAAVAREHPGAVCVGSLAELPALGVVGVTVTTPPAIHAPLALQAIALGLHVVVDKPFALTADEAAEVVTAARDAGALLTVYQNRRWDNDFLTVRALVEAGRLGTVHRFTSRLDRSRPVKPGWSSATPAEGGGTLLDLGPHLIDQALVLLGPAVTVHAELDTRRAVSEARRDAGTGPARGARSEQSGPAEDDIQLHLRHASGARSTLAAGMASPAAGPRFLVNGSAGGLRIEGFDIQEAQLKAGASPASLGEAWGVDPDAAGVLTDLDGTAVTVPLERGRWHGFYPAVAAAVRGEASMPVDPQDAIATARVIDAARESARTGRVIAVAERMDR
jgi:predicted dehydrogenase